MPVSWPPEDVPVHINSHRMDPPMQNRKKKVHMNYEELKERFIEEVKEKLAEQGYDINVSVNEVKKLNETYEAIRYRMEQRFRPIR